MDKERRAALDKAEADLADAHGRIARQNSILEQLRNDGRSTSQAEDLLQTMICGAEAMEEHRRLLLEQLGLYKTGEHSAR
jgi:hypothetical protein